MNTAPLSVFLRTGGKIGAFLGVGVALLYSIFTGVILFFLADLIEFPLGEIIDAVAVMVFSGIGYFLGMFVAYCIWLLLRASER